MFLAIGKGKLELFSNGLGDDVMQFWPKHFGCKPEELTVYWFGEDATTKIKSAWSLGLQTRLFSNGTIERGSETPAEMAYTDPVLDAEGRVLRAPQQFEKTPAVWSMIDRLEGQRVIEWPYDDFGAFRGYKLADRE